MRSQSGRSEQWGGWPDPDWDDSTLLHGEAEDDGKGDEGGGDERGGGGGGGHQCGSSVW